MFPDPVIILFNGPPRSGKDTAAKMVHEILGHNSTIPYRFAEPLKDAVHAMFGMSGIPTEKFDPIKEEPSNLFMGMSPRQAYIWMSEEVMKPKFGRDAWAKIALTAIKHKLATLGSPRAVVISDCGFQEEFDILASYFGKGNVFLCKLERPGTSFKGDSRSYITSHGWEMLIKNDGSFDDLRARLNFMLGEIVNA